MESFTPRSLIAGRIPAGRGNDAEQAAAAAASLLGTDHVAVVQRRWQGAIWYLAAPAADLASHPCAASVLAAALPGAPGHEGDGAYSTALAAGLQAVVVKQGEALHGFVGTPALAERFARLEGATVTHVCRGEGAPWQVPLAAALRRQGHLQTAMAASGLLMAVLGALAWLWAAHDGAAQAAQREALMQEQQAALAEAQRLLEPPAYPKALADLQRAVAQAAREQGALVKFEHAQGRSAWTLNVDGRVVAGASP